MLDRKIIREQLEVVRQALKDRQSGLDLQPLLDLEEKRRSLISRVEALQAQRNQANENIARKKKNKEDASQDISAMKEVSVQIKVLNDELNQVELSLDEVLLTLPNIPHASVPRGPDASANQEVRRWGNPPQFGFTPIPHWDMGERMNILNPAQAAKISGARFMIYRGAGARLERALIQFMLEVQTQENGYTEIFPPLLVNRDAMIGTAQLPKLENDMFRTREEDFFLIPTAEVPLVNIHRQEIMTLDQLPVRYAAYTPCFRREAGSYGKDTKGIVRQHQFNKVELVKIVKPDDSYAELESLVNNAETILQRLELHYRVMLLSTGDMSFASAKTYDLEVWHAGTQRFWEVSSCSNCEAFQARRAGIRYKDENQKTSFCHTLNGSGLATSRLLPAIMENYQTQDGGIMIPKALVPFLGGKQRLTPQGQLE